MCSDRKSGEFNLNRLPIKSMFSVHLHLLPEIPTINQADHQYFSTDLPSAFNSQHFVAIEIFPVLSFWWVLCFLKKSSVIFVGFQEEAELNAYF